MQIEEQDDEFGTVTIERGAKVATVVGLPLKAGETIFARRKPVGEIAVVVDRESVEFVEPYQGRSLDGEVCCITRTTTISVDNKRT